MRNLFCPGQNMYKLAADGYQNLNETQIAKKVFGFYFKKNSLIQIRDELHIYAIIIYVF